MATVSDDLDLIQERLHDLGAIWTRAELLRWYTHGLESFLGLTNCVRRLCITDLPPRYAGTYCFEWEVRHVTGPTWMCLLGAHDATRRCTTAWEVEQVDGVTPSAAYVGVTQQWERAYTDESDRPYQLVLPRHSDTVMRVQWNHRLLYPVGVRELDETSTRWMREVGLPRWFTPGTGRLRSLELYEISTTYGQAYECQDYRNGGGVRGWSGARTYAVSSPRRDNAWAYTTSGEARALEVIPYRVLPGLGWRVTQKATDTSVSFCVQTWEKELQQGTTSGFTAGGTVGTYGWEVDFGAALLQFGVGTPRRITSPDRQYWAQSYGNGQGLFYGSVREVQSEDNAVSVTHSVGVDVMLTEDDVPDLIPSRMQKYLRYYTLSMAFGRQGEGRRGDLSDHYARRFDRGVRMMRKWMTLTRRDRAFVRTDTDQRPGRIPLVRLPSTFEPQW